MPLWSDIKRAACELLDASGTDLLAALDRIESALDNTGMFDRIKAQIKKRQLEMVEIIDYKPCYRKYFRRLNIEWLEKYFSVEPIDKKILGDPNRQILKKGGQILFARVDGEIIGTVALIRRDKTTYELAKMAVTEKAQGKHVGKRLAQAAIDRARSLGTRTLVVNTNPELAAANRLYGQLGFVRVAPTLQQEWGYQRPTITLKLNIEDNKKPKKHKRRYYV
jgi:N-acetylglutamate synthase-like GNAT family acetyltransferase